jgi:exonuclease III
MVHVLGGASNGAFFDPASAPDKKQELAKAPSEEANTLDSLLSKLDNEYSKTFTLRLLKWVSEIFSSANIFFSFAAQKREIISNYQAGNISIMTYNLLGVAQFDHDINHLNTWKNSPAGIDENEKKRIAQQLINDTTRIQQLADNIKKGKADVVALQEVTKEMWDSLKEHLTDYSFVICTPNNQTSKHGVGLLVKKVIAPFVVTKQVAQLTFKTHRFDGLKDMKRNVALLTLDFKQRSWTVLSGHVPQIQDPKDKTLNSSPNVGYNIDQISNLAKRVTSSTANIFIAAADFNQRMHTEEAESTLSNHGFKNFISEEVKHELSQPNPSEELGIDHILVLAKEATLEKVEGESKRIEQNTAPSDHHAHITQFKINNN